MRGKRPSASLFALTLGLSKPPREFGIAAYSTQLLPPWMKRFADYGQGAALMAEEPGDRMPPMSVVDYAAIDSGVPAPPYVLSVLGPDLLSNWDSSDMDAYREKRGRWQAAIVRYLVLALSRAWRCRGRVLVQQRVIGAAISQRARRRRLRFCADPAEPIRQNPFRSPRTAIPGFYLASAYAGFGGYTGVIQSAGVCADMILREG